MNKVLIIIFVSLILLSTLFSIFPVSEFFSSSSQLKITPIFVTIFSFFGLAVALIIRFLEIKYPKEHDEAQKISYTPHVKYGWYALIFFITSMFLFYGYAFLSK